MVLDERSPLTGQLLSKPLPRSADVDRPEADDLATWADVWEEARVQFTLAYPIIGMCLVQYLLSLSSAAFVGHLGALQLAAAQLATSLANATGHYILVSGRSLTASLRPRAGPEPKDVWGMPLLGIATGLR